MEPVSGQSFRDAVLPHLDAAFNLARWLMRNGTDAEDVVQDALVRALQYFDGFRGTNARGWLLQIVRNVAFASMKLNHGVLVIPLDDTPESEALAPLWVERPDGPEQQMIKGEDRKRLGQALEELPVELREVMVLRELEELSYKEIASITQAPIGTVMSRLWRARRLLAAAITTGA